MLPTRGGRTNIFHGVVWNVAPAQRANFLERAAKSAEIHQKLGALSAGAWRDPNGGDRAPYFYVTHFDGLHGWAEFNAKLDDSAEWQAHWKNSNSAEDAPTASMWSHSLAFDHTRAVTGSAPWTMGRYNVQNHFDVPQSRLAEFLEFGNTWAEFAKSKWGAVDACVLSNTHRYDTGSPNSQLALMSTFESAMAQAQAAEKAANDADWAKYLAGLDQEKQNNPRTKVSWVNNETAAKLTP